MEGLFTPKQPQVAPNVLFVCTGNICRSAYAAQALTALLAESANAYGLTVASAGTHAVAGHGMDHTTAQVTRAQGLPTDHIARQLDHGVAGSAGLVLVMTREHRDDVLSRFPALTHQTFTLAEFAALAPHARGARTFNDVVAAIARARYTHTLARGDDVADPYRRPLEEHQRAAAQIDELLQQALPALAGAG